VADAMIEAKTSTSRAASTFRVWRSLSALSCHHLDHASHRAVGFLSLRGLGTHLRRDTVIPQWFQASKAAAASDGYAVHC